MEIIPRFVSDITENSLIKSGFVEQKSLTDGWNKEGSKSLVTYAVDCNVWHVQLVTLIIREMPPLGPIQNM